MTNKITKYEACLNIHGGKQRYDINYFETYALVVTWFSICLLIFIAILLNWTLCQVDSVMAYTQAPIEMNMYMELKMSIELESGKKGEHFFKLLANLYMQKLAGHMQNHNLVDKLLSVGFKQSQIDECVFYHGDMNFIVYVDNGLFIGHSDSKLETMIKVFKETSLDIEEQGYPNDYVGVHIKKHHAEYNSFMNVIDFNLIIVLSLAN